MTSKRYRVFWETDGETIDLPEQVEVDKTVQLDDVANYLSDKYGWLVREVYEVKQWLTNYRKNQTQLKKQTVKNT